jgi:hypothetical protein
VQLTLDRELGSEVVQLVVGSERRLFPVHKKRLCSVSKLFDKVFNSSFAEAANGRIDLPTDTPETVSVFVTWLYGDHVRDMPIDDNNPGALDLYIDLYLFADAKRCEKLKNELMDTIRWGIDQGRLNFLFSHIKRIFDGTCSSCEAPIRTFCAAKIAYGLAEGDLDPRDVLALFKTCPDALEEYLSFQAAGHGPQIYTQAPEKIDDEQGGVYHDCFFHTHDLGKYCDF